ncbi:membrane hypothetical protein [Burkholderiales bacterium 8X]|nr:membrane hypothetical protein [Burkholderiales bacterium 8X]
MKHEIVRLSPSRGKGARIAARSLLLPALSTGSIAAAQPGTVAVLATDSASALYGFPLFVSLCMMAPMLFEPGLRRALGKAILRWIYWLSVPVVLLLVEGFAGASALTVVLVVVSPWIFFLLLMWGLIASV